MDAGAIGGSDTGGRDTRGGVTGGRDIPIAWRRRQGGDWFEANDAAVRLVPPDRVLAAQAYLLFYAPA